MKTFECSVCGTLFETTGKSAKYCPECRIWKKKEMSANSRKAMRARRAHQQIKSTTINDVLRELEEYNKRHGTCYTYGQYMVLKCSGKD